jgi:hypothetical protein
MTVRLLAVSILGMLLAAEVMFRVDQLERKLNDLSEYVTRVDQGCVKR